MISRLLMILFGLGVYEAGAQVLVLDSILEMIGRNNPELKVFDSRIGAYNAYASGARALDPPQLGTGFFMTPYDPGMWKNDAGTNPGMGSWMISAQQMFMNPVKRNAAADYMRSMSGVDREMKKVMQNELYAMAKMNYYEWIILKKKSLVLRDCEEVLNYIIKSSEIRYTYGMDKLSSFYKAKAMLGDIQQMQLMNSLEISQKRINLNTLMNRDKEYNFEVDTVYTFRDYEYQLVDTVQISRSRSDYASLNQEILRLRFKQLYERSKGKPDFGIKYDHMIAFGTQPQQFSVMFMVTVPIAPWSSAMYRSSVEALDFEMEAVRYQQQMLLNTTSGLLMNYQKQIKSKKEQINLYEKTIVPAMRNNYRIALIAFEQNKEELFMILDAWQSLKLVQLTYLDMLNDLLQLQVSYEKGMEIR